MNPLWSGLGCGAAGEPERFEHGPDARLILCFRRHEWQAPDRFEQAHFRQCSLHGDGIRLHKIDFHQRMVAAVNPARAIKIALESEPRELRHFRRNFVRNDGDDAAATQRDQREGDGVVAGKNGEVMRDSVENDGHLRHVAGGFLDAHDVFDCGEALYRCGLDVHSGAALHAVKNDGQRHRFSNGAIVLIQTLLRRLVVIRSDGEYAVGAEGGKLAREGDHFRGVVAAGAREDGYLALSQFDIDLHDAEMLLACECRALAGSAAWNEEVDACLDLPLDQLAQRLFVERTVFPKWGNKSRPGSNKHCVSPSLIERPTAENHRWRPEGRCCISAQFAENLAKFEYTLLSGDPARGAECATGKSVAAARGVTQCDGVHRRVKSNFMRARMRTSAIGSQREGAVVAAGADSFGKFLERAGGRILLGGVVNFPTPCFVFRIFRKEGGGACNCLKEDVDADREIRTVNESSSTR